MKNLNRITYKNSKGLTATVRVGKEMTEYTKENFAIISIEYSEVVEKVDAAAPEIEVGRTYKVKNRVKKVTFVGKVEEYFKGEVDVVLYDVKDGSGRFESVEDFKKWMAKGLV